MKLGTANIQNFGRNLSDGNDMTEADVREDAHKCAVNTTICMMQEISPEDQKPVLSEMRKVTDAWDRLEGTGKYETPIFYRSDFWTVDHIVTVHLERGDAKLTAKNSAIVGARFRSVVNPKIEFAAVNCHLITDGRKGPEGLENRLVMRQNEFTKLEDVVKSFVDQGLTVFAGGDTNWAEMPFPSKHGRWLVGQRRIDKIGVRVSPTGTQVSIETANGFRKELNSDHDLVILDVPLRPLRD